MAPIWAMELGVGKAAIGSVMFFVLAAVGLLMFFVGKWQEKLGSHNMITIGATMVGLDVLLLLFTEGLFFLYLWAFFMGAASCFIYIPGLTVVQKWFPEKRGLVSGVFNMTFGISAAIMAPLFSITIASLGYDSTLILWGAVALCVGIPASRLAKEPEFNRAIVGPGPGTNAINDKTTVNYSLTVSQALKTRNFWLIWIVWALQGAAGISMITLSVPFALNKGFSLPQGVLILTAFNLTNGASRLISGLLSDRIPRTMVMSVAALAAGMAYFGLQFVDGLVLCVLLAVIIGYAFGTLFSVSAPLATDCFGITHFGAIFGLIFTAYGFVAAPLGPALSGFILDYTNGNFNAVFTYLGAFCLISGTLILFVGKSR